MLTRILSRRLTNTYVSTYDHLNKHREVTLAKITPERMTQEPSSYDDGGTYLLWATLPAGLTRKGRDEAAQALSDTYTRTGCHHEWDCCGCASTNARVVHRGGRRIALRVSVYYNY